MGLDYDKGNFVVAIVVASIALAGTLLLPPQVQNVRRMLQVAIVIILAGFLGYFLLPSPVKNETGGIVTSSPSVTSDPPTSSFPRRESTVVTPAVPSAESSSDGGTVGGNDNPSGSDNSSSGAAEEPPPLDNGISRVDITMRAGGALTLVDPSSNTYKLPSYAANLIPRPNISFHWDARSRSGTMSGSCGVSIEVDGPSSSYPQSQLSGDCSGSPNQRFDVYDPGTYTVSVTVTPLNGAPTTGTTDFTLVQ